MYVLHLRTLIRIHVGLFEMNILLKLLIESECNSQSKLGIVVLEGVKFVGRLDNFDVEQMRAELSFLRESEKVLCEKANMIVNLHDGRKVSSSHPSIIFTSASNPDYKRIAWLVFYRITLLRKFASKFRFNKKVQRAANRAAENSYIRRLQSKEENR